MITVTIQVKPYLAAYLQSAYAHCTVEGAIRFTKNQNLYSSATAHHSPPQGRVVAGPGECHPLPALPQRGERPEDL